MADAYRIIGDPALFTAYMQNTDNKQLLIVTPPATKRYTVYNWAAEESAKWTEFRQRSEVLLALLTDEDTTGPGVRKKMKNLINEVRKYDNDKAEGHHLLDKVALNGTVDDCLTFNVKRGTVLAADPTHPGEDVEMKGPILSLYDEGNAYHVMKATNPDAPKYVNLPVGVSKCVAFRFIGTAAPTALKDYKFAGFTERGKYTSKFDGSELQGQTKVYAWYYVCYMNKKGEFGPPSNIEKVEIHINVA